MTDDTARPRPPDPDGIPLFFIVLLLLAVGVGVWARRNPSIIAPVTLAVLVFTLLWAIVRSR